MKRGDTIQGRTLYKGGHYLRKYGIYIMTLVTGRHLPYAKILRIIHQREYLDAIYVNKLQHPPVKFIFQGHILSWHEVLTGQIRSIFPNVVVP